ncbi:MAG: DUF167 domain-containing protein [Candidatus Staskawiczbacteria bacterium]|nr:DUF167 domain-containing protein [Candidatus Staskawiczbacteria bacterium]MBI3337525.1 DUF167 domain-containing protein [Candidatus Staskawiczbacteria bacterium]
MKIFVKAKPNSKEEKIEKINEQNYVVFVKEPPLQGRANNAIKNALAVYFKTGSSCVKIISGHASRNKIVEILK